MARVTAPLCSAQVTGTIGRTLQIQRRRRSSVVLLAPSHANANSLKQRAVRATTGFLGQQWTGLSAGQQSTWATAPGAQATTPVAAFTRLNWARWSALQAPTKAWPADPHTHDDVFATRTATGGAGGVTLTTAGNLYGNVWGYVIMRGKVITFTVAPLLIVGMWPWPGPLTDTYFDAPLSPGTYYYRWGRFTEDGYQQVAWLPEPPLAATVT